ncbi:probable protein NAP1 isoform X3 [Physcomitrium patens]|nr:protein NAP1-like isoform X3 [Physcomitrium patens]XP_024388835.1 protein NAP1-like isoform X3 [Physcomitrium patens]XP_024388836.1 protein NAP1-like isoform X3 [Physcomitrium patens]XP_024388837.1 protein NAP1-like isoform X3 [Physcomitrium patens]PNR44663.1 hypothetical protein PHYPA_014432 [Physcomitrium patens]|eukprot:XP_024388834.1 protein NAP1-like isoform X3 [Physcomitrella patens]
MATQRSQSTKNVQKTRQIEWVIHLQKVALGLMTKLHKLHQILGSAEPGTLHHPDSFWKTGIFPDMPKLCQHVARKFPEHPAKMQLDKVDKGGCDMLHEHSGRYVASLEPWIMVLEDLMTFREQSLRVILDLSSTVVTLLPNQNPLLLRVFMELFCSFVRVNLLADKVPRKMLLQMYNLVHTIMKSGRDYGAYHRMVQFVEAYDPPLKGLHDDLNFVSPRIGEILDAVGPTVLLGSDFQRLRSEGYLSPFHPRYPDKLTNSAHPARAQELVNIEAYREWVLIGYLVCPTELLRPGAVDIALVLLKESILLPLFRDEYVLLHEEYQHYVLPRIAESKKLAKAGRAKGRDADVEYNLAKQVEKQICDAQDTAINNADSAHREHRLLLKQEIGRMLLFFSDQPTLLAPNLQMVFAALVMVRAEILWFFSHVGVMVGKAKGTRVMPIEMDMEDPTIGFLLDGMDRLTGLIRKYTPACKAFAMGYLSAAVQRMQVLLVGPGMVALDIDPELRELFNSALETLDQLPQLHTDKIVPASLDLSGFRRDWLRLIMLVSSSRSPINIRHLDKATVSTGNDSIVSEGNLAYLWSRSVDEMDKQILQHASLKMLYFYRPDVTAVFRHTMFGPEGRPQHCCAWLSLACTFSDNAHPNVPDELPTFARDAVSYAESILDSVMGGLEGLINILDSEGGYGSLDNKLLLEQAALRLNQLSRAGIYGIKNVNGMVDFPLPGFESEPIHRGSIKMLEAAVQRLTSLCSVLNEMEPLRVLNHMFVPREYLRDRIMKNFRTRLKSIIMTNGELQRPSVVEARLQRHMSIVHLVEQHVQLDLTRGVREVLLTESFARHMEDLHPDDREVGAGGEAVCTIADWYVENLLRDAKASGVIFSPLDKCFKSTRPIGRVAAESVADLAELKAFVRIFGPYGVDKLCNSLLEQLTVLVDTLDTFLRSNKEILESLAGNLHSKSHRENMLLQIVELEILMSNAMRIGHMLSMRALLAEATGQVLRTNTPLLFSLLTDFCKHAPATIPEKPNLLRLKRVSSRVGAVELEEGDAVMIHSILNNMEGAGDPTWGLLPFLFVACMNSNVWNSTTFSVLTGGFTSNVHCLARCINAVMIANEWVRSERREQHRLTLDPRNGSMGEDGVQGVETRADVNISIKASMKTFLQCAVATVLESWDDSHRSPLVAKLIFLDQLCELTNYLPRSTLEGYVPHTIMRSIYQMYFENSVPSLVHVHPSTRQYAGNGGPIKSQGDTSAEPSEIHLQQTSRGSIFSGPIKFAGQHKRPEVEPSGELGPDGKPRRKANRFSGPLDYSRKVSFAEGRGPPEPAPSSTRSPLGRFRSGPLSYV